MSKHPRHEELAGLVFGDLSDDQAEKVARHVDQCPQCEDTVRELETASDDVIRLLRRPVVEHPFEQEPQCRRLVEVIEAIGCDPSMAGASSKKGEELEDLGTIRDYQLLAKLGQGGMGTVYKALHGKLKKVVALKILPAERLKHTHAVERFELEMEAVGRLTHPNIVGAHDAGEHEGTHYLVMEYVDGVDLSELVQRLGPLSIADACELIRQAAVGLEHAHEHKLVHRDIKPSNLMLERGERPKAVDRRLKEEMQESSPPTAYSLQSTASLKILDLGLARLHNGDRVELTSTGQMMGTVDYMAPEQTGDSHAVDIRADIYSLGATLFKLLCGRAPYADARYDTVLKKLKAMAMQPVPSIQGFRSEVPDELAAVLEKMLATEPDDRFATPQEVAEALAPFAEGADLATLSARYYEAQQTADDAADAADRSGGSTDEHLSCSMTETATVKSSHPAPRDEQSDAPSVAGVERSEPPEHSDLGAHSVRPQPPDRPTEEEPVGQAVPDEMDAQPARAATADLEIASSEQTQTDSRQAQPDLQAEMARSGDRPQREGEAPAEPHSSTVSARREPRPPGMEITTGAPVRWNRNTKIAAVALGLAALFAGVMVIRVATDKGEIKITAYNPELEVTIKRNDKPIDGFQVKQRPEGTSYYSGDYEIEIVGGMPDGVEIKNGTFKLTRGKEVLVQIVHVGQAVPDDSIAGSRQAQPDLLVRLSIFVRYLEARVAGLEGASPKPRGFPR